jgi:hypothetical protein
MMDDGNLNYLGDIYNMFTFSFISQRIDVCSRPFSINSLLIKERLLQTIGFSVLILK